MFRQYSKELRFQEDTKDRLTRKQYFKDRIHEKLNELNFSEMIRKLWASQIWANKDYLVDKIVKDNGIEKLAEEFSHFVSRRGTPGERYEQFLKNIKGMGPSMITEILCYADPKNAGIWNSKARKALDWLEVKNIPHDKYKISGQEYDQFNEVLKELAILLAKEDHKDVDLLFVDYFLWEIWNKYARQEKAEQVKDKGVVKSASKHDELRDKVDQIGSWLGFETETEKLIATGAKVDCLWRGRIANLGTVSYIFEVQISGSVDSLILNLQKAQTNPTVQKLVIISDNEQLEKIQKEIKEMPESFRKAITFWEIEDVENTYQGLEQVTNSIARLKLVEE